MALTPKFSNNEIRNYMQGQLDLIEDEMIRVLRNVGYKAINIARERGSYTDRTANLRNSVGFLIKKDDLVIDSSFNNAYGKEFAMRVSTGSKGIVLFVVAGMNYASYVQSKGYDVLASAQLEAEVILEDLLTQLER